jgi:hypothetical protein
VRISPRVRASRWRLKSGLPSCESVQCCCFFLHQKSRHTKTKTCVIIVRQISLTSLSAALHSHRSPTSMMPGRTPPRRASRGSGQGFGKRERTAPKPFSPEPPAAKAKKKGGEGGGGRGGKAGGRGRGRGAAHTHAEGVNTVRPRAMYTHTKDKTSTIPQTTHRYRHACYVVYSLAASRRVRRE